MIIHNLSDQNSIANNYLAQMRDVSVQSNKLLFRKNMERLGNIMAYEVSKHLQYAEKDVETPLGIANMQLMTDSVVLCTILRAGLSFHQGMLDFLDESNNAFIAAYRKNHKDGTFEINLEYVTCPSLENKTLVLIDPMLATGSSIKKTLDELVEHGQYSQLHIVSIIASANGVEYIKRHFPGAHLWVVAIDDELTAKSYIVPGLGDAGDLAYGIKVQE